jgi:Domain of unknown function (DUF4190)
VDDPFARDEPLPDAFGPRYQPAPTNGCAVASLVLGILWIWWIGSILALFFGYLARSQIKAAAGRQGGDGLAIAGIVLGWVGAATFLYVLSLVGSPRAFLRSARGRAAAARAEAAAGTANY